MKKEKIKIDWSDERMKYLKWIHDTIGNLKKLVTFLEFEIIELIDGCKFYSYDSDAFEEYCNCPKIIRKGEFNASEECWKCKYYKVKKK